MWPKVPLGLFAMKDPTISETVGNTHMANIPGSFLYNHLSNIKGIKWTRLRKNKIPIMIELGNGITPWLAINEAEKKIKKVNREAFQKLTFLKYLKFTATVQKEMKATFHFGEPSNKQKNRIDSKRKFVFPSLDVSLYSSLCMIF